MRLLREGRGLCLWAAKDSRSGCAPVASGVWRDSNLHHHHHHRRRRFFHGRLDHVRNAYTPIIMEHDEFGMFVTIVLPTRIYSTSNGTLKRK